MPRTGCVIALSPGPARRASLSRSVRPMARGISLVPNDKKDLRTARRAIERGWPAVEPVLGDLLDWCLDSNWPVAKILGPFLGRLGAPVVPLVRAVLNGDDEPAKYH